MSKDLGLFGERCNKCFRDDNWIVLMLGLCLFSFILGTCGGTGCGRDMTIREAAKQGAGMWVTDKDGAPKWQWRGEVEENDK